MSCIHASPRLLAALAGVFTVVVLAVPAAAQAPAGAPDPNPGNMTVVGGFDVVSNYMFRGIRQHATGVALWPATDLGLTMFSGEGSVKSVGLNLGIWNSLHTGDSGSDGPTGKLWYESDFYAAVGFGLGGGTSLSATYTAYTSPNNTFTTVKELALKIGVDDSAHLGKAALKPYALVAFEFDTEPGVGQADGGLDAGRYLELGVAPGYAFPRASLAFPTKVGLSLGDYYELNTGTADEPAFEDSTFGFFSVGAVVTIPLGPKTSFGEWAVRGGIEFQALGETTKAFHGGDSSRVIGTFGIGFTY
jgi:hypothetical protein